MKSFMNNILEVKQQVNNNLLTDNEVKQQVNNNLLTDNEVKQQVNKQVDGGLSLNKNKHIVVFYSNLFIDQASRLNNHLNNNGIKCVDITELLLYNLFTPIGINNIITMSKNNNSDNIIDTTVIKQIVNQLLKQYDDYKVFMFNLSKTKCMYIFDDYIQMYITSNKPLLTKLNNININLFAELLDIDNIYETEENNKNVNNIKDLIILNNEISSNMTIIHNLSIWNTLYNNKDEFINFMSKYGQKVIIKLKNNTEAVAIGSDIENWDQITLNNIKNILND